MRLTSLASTAVLAATLACAGAPPAAGQEQPAPLPVRPLAAFAARRVVVLPAHYLRPGDPMGWAGQITDPADYLADVDAEIAFALSERGVAKRWVSAEAITRAAKRNPGFAPDPHDLAAQWLRPPSRKNPDRLPEPFGSQVRTLIALEEDAQYLLLPVEIRFEPAGKKAGAQAAGDGTAGGGGGRAVLRVALLDARRSRIVWMADVASDPSSSFSPALAASVAEHLADLIAAP